MPRREFSSKRKIQKVDASAQLALLVVREHKKLQRWVNEEFQNCLAAHPKIERVSPRQKREVLDEYLNALGHELQELLRNSCNGYTDFAIKYRPLVEIDGLSWVTKELKGEYASKRLPPGLATSSSERQPEDHVPSDLDYAVNQERFRGWVIVACEGLEALELERAGGGVGEVRRLAYKSGTKETRWLAPKWLSDDGVSESLTNDDLMSKLNASETECAISELWMGFNLFVGSMVEQILEDAERRIALASDDDPEHSSAATAKRANRSAVLPRRREPRTGQVRGRQKLFCVLDDEYRSIRWNNKEYPLTRNQSLIVKTLHEAHERGTPLLPKAALLRAIEAETSRLRDSFKNSPLWGTLIVPVRKPRGTYKLNLK